MAKKTDKLIEQQEEPEEVEVEESVQPIEEVEETEVNEGPRFKNNGDGIKIKLMDGKEFKWITVKSGEIVTIPKKIALANKLEEVK